MVSLAFLRRNSYSEAIVYNPGASKDADVAPPGTPCVTALLLFQSTVGINKDKQKYLDCTRIKPPYIFLNQYPHPFLSQEVYS